MRLVGYALQRRPFFTQGAYVPLGDLTVLLGANDAGKTTVLRALASDLSDNAGDDRLGGCAFYFETDADELALLTAPPTATSTTNQFSQWSHGGYRRRSGFEPAGGESPVEIFKQVLTESATSEEFRAVLEALSASPLVCVERDDPALVTGAAWLVHWCLPPLATLDPEVAAALEASDLHRFAAARARADQRPYRRNAIFGKSTPLWLQLPEAPVIVAPLGALGVAMPRALSIPADAAEIRATIVETLRKLVNVSVWAERDAAANHELEPRDMLPREGIQVLLEDTEGGAVRPAQVAVGALRLLTSVASAELPDFVSARYRLTVRCAPVRDWFDGIVVELRLQPVDDAIAAFDAEDVADGLKLWLQLALLAGVDLLDRLADELGALADRDYDDFLLAQQSASEGTAERPRFREAIEAIVAIASLDPEATPELPAALGLDGRPAARYLRMPGHVLLADEPEQHLNPRLQRRAARWLAELATGSEAPCIAASHSAAFLSLPPGAQMVHVRRKQGKVEVTPFEPHEAAELDWVAADLGFDRGELLSAVSCLLLVEGEHEIVSLEGIFGRELREAKVSLVALRGSPPKGLLDVDALWRFTTAAVLVCLDNVRPEVVDAAQEGDETALSSLRRSTANEEKAIAALIERAQNHDRPLQLVGHPGIDLIDALDPAAVRRAYPKYPTTHAEADAAYRRAVERAESTGVPKPSRKEFYAQEYEVDNSRHAYERIAAAHQELGIRPTALAVIVAAATAAAVRADLSSLGLTAVADE